MQKNNEYQIEKEKIAKFILQKRKEYNLTQQDLANKLYVSDRAVSKWERAISIPDIETLVKLCNIFNVTTDELILGNIDNKKTENLKNKRYIIISSIIIIIVFILYNISTILINFNIEYIFATYLILFLGLIIFINNSNNILINKKIVIVATTLYSITLFSYTFYTGISNRANNIIIDSFKSNFIPIIPIFQDIDLVLRKIQPISILFNYTFVNLCSFMPYTLFIPYLKKNIKTYTLIIIMLGLIILKELLQLITGYGIFDINDIILNTLGVFIAYKFLNKLNII